MITGARTLGVPGASREVETPGHFRFDALLTE
jgi:hypothetical protein